MTFTGTLSDVNAALDGLKFDPTPDYNGPANIQITTDDQGNTGGGALTDTDNVRITVLPVNDEESLDTNDPLVVNEGATGTITQILLKTIDIDNTPLQLTYTVTRKPTYGTLLLSGFATATFTQSDINAGLVTYQHNGSENFSDSFDFDVDDGVGSVTSATFNINVTPVNDNTPVADTESFTVLEGGTATEADLDTGTSLLDGDTDIDLPNDTLTVNTTPVAGPSFGLLTLNANGTFSYAHDGSENFIDSFTYEVSDAVGNTDTATVTITITPVNDAPAITSSGTVSVAENSTAVVTVTSSDPDGGFPTYTISGGADASLFFVDLSTGDLTF